MVWVYVGLNIGELFVYLIKGMFKELYKIMDIIVKEGKGVILLFWYDEEEDLIMKIIKVL